MPSPTSLVRLTTPKSTPATNLPQEQMNRVQILKYMGNKRGILEWLIPLLKEELSYGQTMLDLFAGTSSVGYALKPYAKIFANDIQEYSATISNALLRFNDKVSGKDYVDLLQNNYEINKKDLGYIFRKFLKLEDYMITSKDVSLYGDLAKSFPSYGSGNGDYLNLGRYASESFLNKRRLNPKEFPYILFSAYYSNSFFSLRQCIDIDSLRYSIDQIPSKERRDVYLSCLMYSMSKAVSSSGHFAEYLDPNSTNAKDIVFKARSVSIVDKFIDKLKDFESMYVQKNWNNEVFNCDYRDLIKSLSKEKKLDALSLIYIDPPYTTAQYSRFYHIPETLVKYDYPELSINESNNLAYKGRYRIGRHISKFSQKTNVEDAFSEMFDIISSQTSATLAVSYSDNSVVKPVDRLIEIANKKYKIVEKKNGHIHSAQGSRFKKNNSGVNSVHEYLLICKRR